MTKSAHWKPEYLYKISCDISLEDNVQCKGVALIVSNNYEGSRKLKPLPSTDGDSRNMTEFFKALKNYEVITRTNLSSDDFLSICKDLASAEYPDIYKRIVIYFAGHGGNGTITMNDGKAIRIDKIQSLFDPIKRPNLKNIARIYLFDTCRGPATYPGDDERSGDHDDERSGDHDDVADHYEPRAKHGNELVAYSTLKGHVAHDDKFGLGGSWTSTLYVCLIRQRNLPRHLADVLTYVNHELGPNQTSSYNSSLDDFIYFWIEAGLVPADSVAADTGGYQDTDLASVTVTATAPLGGGQEGESFTTQSPPEPQTSPPSDPVPVLLSGNQPSHSTQAEDQQLGEVPADSAAADTGGGQGGESFTTQSPPEEFSTEETGGEVHYKSIHYADNNTDEADGRQLEVTSTPIQQLGEEASLLVAHKTSGASDIVLPTKQRSIPKKTKAFILYQNERDLCDYALSLANFLRIHCSVDCEIADYLNEKDVDNWDIFIGKYVELTEYVLLICTEKLKNLLNSQSENRPRITMTSSNEPFILSATLNNLFEKKTVVPIILQDDSRECIPTLFRSTTVYTISRVPNLDADVKTILNRSENENLKYLVARLCKMQLTPKPPVAISPPDLQKRRLW